jgi:predicted component of type VI protein secretion system
VSARHAQLIHDGGRWRLVNLVSANGIFVNGEKRLTAYLSDGDELRFGMATLKFHTARGAAGNARPASAKGPAAPGRKPVAGGGQGGLPLKWIVVGAVLMGLLAVGGWLLL